MKLTRLTNQSPARKSPARSIAQGTCGKDLQLGWQRRDHGTHGDTLRGESRHGRQGAHVVDCANRSQQRRCRAQRQELGPLILQEDRRQANRAPGDHQRRDEDRDATALRRRLVVRGTGVRLDHRIAREPGPQQHRQPHSQEERDKSDGSQDPETLNGLLSH
jgi:hypothetical protein